MNKELKKLIQKRGIITATKNELASIKIRDKTFITGAEIVIIDYSGTCDTHGELVEANDDPLSPFNYTIPLKWIKIIE